MRLVATILNIVLIGTVILLISQDSRMSEKELAMSALFLLTPIASLIAIYFNRGESWISLYFKRKAMEEKKIIDKLNDKKS